MSEEAKRMKGSQVPHGVQLAALVATEARCGYAGCESWKTVGFDVDLIEDGEYSVIRYVICTKHLPEFIEAVFLEADGILGPDDCGDPDCPIHGEDYDDDDDYFWDGEDD